jgi:hypothetical protein
MVTIERPHSIIARNETRDEVVSIVEVMTTSRAGAETYIRE